MVSLLDGVLSSHFLESMSPNVLITFYDPVYVCLFSAEIKKKEDQGKERCHGKPMMSNETNKKMKYTLNMCRLGRTQRKKYEGTI